MPCGGQSPEVGAATVLTACRPGCGCHEARSAAPFTHTHTHTSNTRIHPLVLGSASLRLAQQLGLEVLRAAERCKGTCSQRSCLLRSIHALNPSLSQAAM